VALLELRAPTHYLARRETLPALVRCAIAAVLVGTLFTINLYATKDLHILVLWIANVVALFWMTFGGHWLELIYVDLIANHLPNELTQRLVRITLWFTVGSAIVLASAWTRGLFGLADYAVRDVTWTVAGLFFVAIQLVIHGTYWFFGQPSFWTHDG
jgi:hypothetical protein